TAAAAWIRRSFPTSSTGSRVPATYRAASPAQGSGSRSPASSQRPWAAASNTHRSAPVPASCSGSLLGNRQLDREGRAAAAVRDDPDAAVHAVHELAADVEPQPGAA